MTALPEAATVRRADVTLALAQELLDGVVADNARLTCSAASEIVATVTQQAFASLKAAPERVAWEDLPIPFSPPLEARVVVDEDKIRTAVRRTLGA